MGRFWGALPTAASILIAGTSVQAQVGYPEASWTEAVRQIAFRAASRVSSKVDPGSYLLHFVVERDGSVDRIRIEGARYDAAQYALISGALALTRFPPPPDGIAHPVSVRERFLSNHHRRRRA